MSVKENILNRANWLASEVGLVVKTITVPSNASNVTENGRKIVKSGTIFTTPYHGLLLNDADITDGNTAAALVVSGFYIDAKLPVSAASSVTDFATQGLFPLAEGAITRPDFGSLASLEKLAKPVLTYTVATKVLSWAEIVGAVGYKLYLGTTLFATFDSDATSATALSGAAQNGSYTLVALGDNLYKVDSVASTAVTVTGLEG